MLAVDITMLLTSLLGITGIILFVLKMSGKVKDSSEGDNPEDGDEIPLGGMRTRVKLSKDEKRKLKIEARKNYAERRIDSKQQSARIYIDDESSSDQPQLKSIRDSIADDIANIFGIGESTAADKEALMSAVEFEALLIQELPRSENVFLNSSCALL
jgi:hypothetical protein